MPVNSRSVWWDHFYRGKDKYATDSTHWKAFCRNCVDALVRETTAREFEHAYTSTGAAEPRTEIAIRQDILEHDLVQPICGKIDIMLRHLTVCLHTDSIRDHAHRELERRRDDAKNSSALRRMATLTNKENNVHQVMGPRTATRSSITPTSSHSSFASTAPDIATPSADPVLDPPLALAAPTHAIGLTLEDAAGRPAKRRRLELEGIEVSSGTDIFYGETIPATRYWPENRQAQFAADLCRLFIACNIAWTAADNPVFRQFFKQWLPGALVPSRKVLSGRVLDEEAERVMGEMRTQVQGMYATGQCDGWKNITRDSLVASTINVQYTPWFLNIFDISAAAKTARNLLQIVIEEIQFCITHLSVMVVAYCTDAGGDAKAMRELLRQKFPWLITVDCWAHQLNLLVGDYFKHMRHYAGYMDQAEEVIKWFNNHTRALAMLGEEQRHRYNGRVLSLLYPVATRWSSRYLSCVRLLEIESALRCLLLTKIEDLVKLTTRGKNNADTERKREKTREVLSAALRSEFWAALHTLRKHLAPFTIATNIAQSDNARLDTVLLTLGKLFSIFTDPVQIEEESTRQTVPDLLEARWRKIGRDREVFILALLLNPYIRCDAFNPTNPSLTPAALWNMYKRVFSRVMQREPDIVVMEAYTQYISRTGAWSDQSMGLNDWKARAANARTHVNLVSIWRAHQTRKEDITGTQAFVTFAARLLSVVPNTGATERTFSKMGTVHTKSRNRLKTERVRKTVLIKDHLLREYPLPDKVLRRQDTPSPSESESESDSPEDEGEMTAPSSVNHRRTRSVTTPAFSALVEDAINAALSDWSAHPAASESLDIAPPSSSEGTRPQSYPNAPFLPSPAANSSIDDLSLRNLFDYSPDSASFKQLTDELWASGQHILDRERCILESNLSLPAIDSAIIGTSE